MSFALLGIPDLSIVAWLAISLVFAFDAGLLFLGCHYTEHHRKPRWERRARLERAKPINLEAARRVRDRTRRGPSIDRRAS